MAETLLTVADIISIAMDKCHLHSGLQKIFYVGDILPGGITNAQEGIRDRIWRPTEIDRSTKVLLNPLLVEEASCVHMW